MRGTYPFKFKPKDINVGRSAQSYGAYSLTNDTTTVQVDFNSDISEQKLTFEIPIQAE
ncbi:hypothetical protein [Niallia endozanthoxylica]|uniref:hypothetical protein n=1 Tax=Niallia endozanthoxylica TaxID=2036016 RepID=UPI00168B883F|nr:hypothetical protein [Niallia endozanthoxylica]